MFCRNSSRLRKLAAVASLLALSLSSTAHAQEAARAPSIAKPIFWGAALGFGGIFVGAAMGASSASDGSYDELGHAIVGAIGGEILGVAIGVHAGNNGRGMFMADLAVSALTLIAGGAMLANSENEDGPWLLVPIAQLALTVATERGTESPKSSRPSALIGLGPAPNRGIGLGASLSF
jgi:hypothetical protein